MYFPLEINPGAEFNRATLPSQPTLSFPTGLHLHQPFNFQYPSILSFFSLPQNFISPSTPFSAPTAPFHPLLSHSSLPSHPIPSYSPSSANLPPLPLHLSLNNLYVPNPPFTLNFSFTSTSILNPTSTHPHSLPLSFVAGPPTHTLSSTCFYQTAGLSPTPQPLFYPSSTFFILFFHLFSTCSSSCPSSICAFSASFISWLIAWCKPPSA